MLRIVRTPVLAAALALGVSIAPGAGSASNGNKPRTPVVWSAGPCGTVVDRSTTTTLHFEYGVADEDVGPRTEDEVDDSRTHQFFAFAELDYAAVATAQRLPPFITDADIERAALVDPDVVPADIDAIDVLETTSRFSASDWTRITADDGRVPITDAQAAMGVDWDVTAVPPGVYTVWGYTWEPLINLWVPRPGFVKLIASAGEADAVGPAIALIDRDEELTIGEPAMVAGCVDAAEGSTVTLEWGVVEGPLEPQWHALIQGVAIASGELALEATLPAEAMGDAPGLSLVRLRATVTDPSGRRHVAHSPDTYVVRAGEIADESDGSGGGCSASGSRGSVAVLLLALLLGARRRRAIRLTRSC